MGVAILAADKINFKSKEVKRDKDAHYQQQKIILNIYMQYQNAQICKAVTDRLKDDYRDFIIHFQQ